MINYDFLYDKTHYDRYTRVNHFSKENLSWKVYDEATVLPFSRGYSEVVGGLLDSKGKYIDGSGLHRGMGYAYTFNEGKVKYRDETIVLLGIWPNIWGHWLTDNIRRLWVLKNKEFMSQYGNCRFIYLPFDHQNIGKNARELLEILGVKDVTLEAEDEIIKYKRVILPDECFFCAPDSNRYYTKEYVSMINDIRTFAKNGWTDTGLRKVYFTYKGYSIFRSMCEDRLERFFADQGYRIISPEEYTFREQLDILLSCTHFASTVGSAAHNIVFLKDQAKVYLIPRTDFITTYQFALDEIHDLDITYVDSSMSVYTHPERPWEGPFYYIISDNLLGLFGRKAGRRNNSKGFSGYRRIGIWMNGHHNISDYYKKEYGKYMDVPIEKAENVPMIFQLCEKLHIRIIVMKIMFRLEALYAYLRHDNR